MNSIYNGLTMSNAMGLVNMQNQMQNQMQNNSAFHAAMSSQVAYQNAGMQSAANQMASTQALAALYNGKPAVTEVLQYMIDGKLMNMDDFVNEIFPEDTREKTMFLLKHTKITGET